MKNLILALGVILLSGKTIATEGLANSLPMQETQSKSNVVEALGFDKVSASQERSDGRYNVLCTDGSFEVVTKNDLNTNNLCPHAAGSDLPNSILSILRRSDGKFDVICKNLSQVIASGDEIVQGKICLGSVIPVWSEIILKPDGLEWRMTQTEAINYCKSLGSHLPSPKEYRQLAISHGAFGAFETEFPNVQWEDSGLWLEMRHYRNLNKKCRRSFQLKSEKQVVVDNYFCSEGFSNPSSSAHFQGWTSSTNSLYPPSLVQRSAVFIFGGNFAVQEVDLPDSKNAVRCVR